MKGSLWLKSDTPFTKSGHKAGGRLQKEGCRCDPATGLCELTWTGLNCTYVPVFQNMAFSVRNA